MSLISLNFFFKFPTLSNLLYNCYFFLFIIFLFDVIVLFDIYRFLYKTCNYFYMFLYTFDTDICFNKFFYLDYYEEGITLPFLFFNFE